MTGYESKKAMAQDKLESMEREALKLALETFESMNHDDSIFKGEFDGEIAVIKEALAQPALERNFCPRCGKRTWDIHTCTAPLENT